MERDPVIADILLPWTLWICHTMAWWVTIIRAGGCWGWNLRFWCCNAVRKPSAKSDLSWAHRTWEAPIIRSRSHCIGGIINGIDTGNTELVLIARLFQLVWSLYFLLNLCPVFFFNEQTGALVSNGVNVNFLYIATIYILTTKNQSFSSSHLWGDPDLIFNLPSSIKCEWNAQWDDNCQEVTYLRTSMSLNRLVQGILFDQEESTF